jgi:serine/threonine-protein kinase
MSEEIGRGGFARVYRAWDAHQARRVVVKQANLDTISIDVLLREAEILSQLHHPAIPAILDCFEEAGRSYLVEEYRDGVPLSQMRLFLPDILALGGWCCQLLAYLHRQDLVYRDLAPGNVLMEGAAFSLVDFGLTCWLSDPPWRGGSRGYAAPEQWRDGVIDPTCDLYSLGMLLGCALADVMPQEVLQAGSFSHLWEAPGSIPPEIRLLLALFDRMIAPSPEDRPGLLEVQRTLARLNRQMPS